MILKATSLQIKAAENWLETASWRLIALLGAWLLWTRLRGDPHHHHASTRPASRTIRNRIMGMHMAPMPMTPMRRGHTRSRHVHAHGAACTTARPRP
jgi:ABC-type nickel/cobalt efflux system permease component RcnA